jgi:DNA helicase Pif1-like protein
MDSVVSVVKLNSLRHRLNHLAMIQFARHGFTCSRHIIPGCLGSIQQLHAEAIFERQDEGIKVPSQGLFLYTPGMPCMILANISSSAGLVNGCRGIATGVIMEPNSKTCPLCLTLLIKYLIACNRATVSCPTEQKTQARPRQHRF